MVSVGRCRADVDTDPQRWSNLLLRLQTVKEICELHHARFVVVVVCDELKDLPADVISTFKSRFDLDDRSISSLLAINVDPSDPSIVQLANNELKSIGHMILENAWAVHQHHAQRILLESSQRSHTSQQLNVLDCCKVKRHDCLLLRIYGISSWDSWRNVNKNGHLLCINTIWHIVNCRNCSEKKSSK